MYVLMAIAISVGTTAIMLAGGDSSRERLASKVSLHTGTSMLATTLVLLGAFFGERA